MAPNTTKTGIEVLDRAFGGVYLHHPTVVCGKRKSGKFVFATQFLVKTLRAGERIILFTSKRPPEVIASIKAEYFDINDAVDSGQLVICPYSSMLHSSSNPYAPLPFPEAFDELTALVKDNGISYAIFDSVVPWTAIEPEEAMPEHVDTFVSTLSMLGLTSLLILPEPASAAALSLATVLRELCPINIELEARDFGANFIFRVTKFQGMAKAHLPMEFTLDIVPGVGFETLGSNDKSKLEDVIGQIPAEPPAKASPGFRPFLVTTLANFSSSGGKNPPLPAAEPMPEAGKAMANWSSQAFSGVESHDSAPPPQPAPMLEQADFAPLPQPPAASAGEPPAPLPPEAPAVTHTSFANVVDLPDFPPVPETPAREAGQAAAQGPRPRIAHSFSQVIN